MWWRETQPILIASLSSNESQVLVATLSFLGVVASAFIYSRRDTRSTGAPGPPAAGQPFRRHRGPKPGSIEHRISVMERWRNGRADPMLTRLGHIMEWEEDEWEDDPETETTKSDRRPRR